MRSFFGFIILIIAFFGLVSFVNWIKRPGPVGCAFTLTSSNNTPVTEKDIRAKPAVVFFGYTMCPDVCPTTMQDMEVWIKQLGKDADKLGWWFFSVDPEHDTPEVMHDYLSSLPHNIVGITGNPKEVRKVIKAFNIVAIKVPGENNDYTYDHTATVILLNKGGTSFGVIPYQPDVGSNDQRNGIGIDRLKQLIKNNS